MTKSDLRILPMLLLVASLSGCVAAHELPSRPPASLDEGGNLEPVTFLLRGVRVPAYEDVEGGRIEALPGFDLDGLVTTSEDWEEACVERSEDYLSSLDPDERGVDNAFAELAPILDPLLVDGGLPSIEAATQRAIAEGRLLLAVEIEGLHVAEDREVRARIYAVEPLEGELRAERYEVGGEERLRPLPQALRGRLLVEVSGESRGDLVTLRFDRLPIEIEGAPLPLFPLEDLTEAPSALSLRFTPEGGIEGALGGSISAEALRESALALGFDPGQVDIVIEALRGVIADLEPSATEPGLCDRVSVGLGLDLVQVEPVAL